MEGGGVLLPALKDRVSERQFKMTPGDLYPPSPVPADAWLLPGEKPFTAFGHLGDDKLDLRVFEQDIYWVDRFGRPHVLTEMPEDYRQNVIAFLHDHVHGFHAGALLRSLALLVSDLMLHRPNGDLLAQSVGGAAVHEMNPEEWLEATPLMRRLKALTAHAE